MKSPRPVVLIVAVVACALVLALHQWGVFVRVTAAWRDTVSRWLTGEVVEGARVLPWQYAFHTAAAFIASYVCAGMKRRGNAALFLVGFLFLIVTLALTLASRGVVAEPLSGVLAALLAGIGGLVVAGSEKGGRVVAFRDFFAHRITEEKFDQLIVNREPVKLSGTREVSTLSCRILNVAELAHRMEVTGIEQMTSAFQKLAGDFLVERGAYLDVTSSHGVTVQFGFPLRDARHAQEACKVALELKELLIAFVADALKRWEQKPVIGVGIASGPVVCGLIGYESFQSYSVMGAAVDASRRLCEVKGSADVNVIIDSATQAAAKDEFQLKAGKDSYELTGRKS